MSMPFAPGAESLTLTEKSTGIDPACSKVSVTLTLWPFTSGCFKSMNITWDPPGAGVADHQAPAPAIAPFGEAGAK